MELNVFNGDCAWEAWRKGGGNSPALVWRENYLEGRLPGIDVPLEEFERVRAEELHQRIPELDLEKLLASLLRADRTIMAQTAGDSVFLWFDACMYDQVMLARILFLLRGTSAAVFLICEDIAWGNHPELFEAKKPASLRLASADLVLYAAAWQAITEGDDALKNFLATSDLSRFPFLEKALMRYREEFPGSDGLGRSERQLLETIRSGKHCGTEIFRAVGEYEEYPFMGDTMCWRLLAQLVEKGFLVIQSDGDQKTYYLS